MTQGGFSVDTHLLRELGELLVGRDSTAVVELIKNAYDADATAVTLDAVDLAGSDGRIVVADDGNGMTEDRFRSVFLRIAGRDKEEGERRSVRFGRRYTGQKGIGRLATHKLAGWLGVSSVPRLAGRAVDAVIDWDEIERQDDLVNLQRGLTVRAFDAVPGQPHGTVFELRRLKLSWTPTQRELFVREVQSARAPSYLLDPEWPRQHRTTPSMLGFVKSGETKREDPGFEVHLTGDLATGDALWDEAAERFTWVVEIDATTDVVEYEVAPLRTVRDEPEARVYRFRRTLPLLGRPAFQARIFVLGRGTGRGSLGKLVRDSGGIRVYLEGFRVLPYGSRGDDWLNIGRDYRQGARVFRIPLDDGSDTVASDKREGLVAFGSENYFGAVFLTDSGSAGLRSLVNREGFVPDAPYESLVELVRAGVDLSVRVRRAVHLAGEQKAARDKVAGERRRRKEEEEQQSRAEDSGSSQANATRPPADGGAGDDAESTWSHRWDDDTPTQRDVSVDDEPSAEQIVDEARQAAARLRTSATLTAGADDVSVLLSGFTVADAELELLRGLQSELRTLAGVGLQLGAFVHEINGLLGQATTIRELLGSVLGDPALSRQHRTRLRRVERGVLELTHGLARQSSYLTDVVGPDPRRRRSRVRLAERLDPVQRLLASQFARRGVELEIGLPPDLKTPPMFPAEVTVLLTNLLTNAVKNAGSPGRIRVDGESIESGGVRIYVHNTGVAVDLDEAERWFRPFESTSTEIDDVLGQGLGLGLPITRALVEDYRGSITFVPPPQGFATNVRVDLPDPKENR